VNRFILETVIERHCIFLVLFFHNCFFIPAQGWFIVTLFFRTFLKPLKKKYKKIPEEISKKGEIDEILEEKLVKSISDFKTEFMFEHQMETEMAEHGEPKTN